MRRLITLVLALCLSAGIVHAQQYFYCINNTAQTILSGEDFYLATSSNASRNSAGLQCEFNAQTTSVAFFLDIQVFQVTSSILTISSGNRTLFHGSSLPTYQSSISTTSASLKVVFAATRYSIIDRGFRIRVRAFDSTKCPRGWVLLYGVCFGTSNTTGMQNFQYSQRACSSMRANLLHLPLGYLTYISTLKRRLPLHLKSYYTWIGAMQKSNGLVWIDGIRLSTLDVGCISGGPYSRCNSNQRCGLLKDLVSSQYSIYMDNCGNMYPFACMMPPGGADKFYSVSEISVGEVSTAWIWGVTIASVFFAAMVISAFYGVSFNRQRLSSRLASRSRQNRNADVSADRTIPWAPRAECRPTSTNHISRSAMTRQPSPHGNHAAAAGLPPAYTEPPSYEEAVQSAEFVNAAYAK